MATHPLRTYVEMLVREQLELHQPTYHMEKVEYEEGTGPVLYFVEPAGTAVTPISDEPLLVFKADEGNTYWQVNVENDDNWAGIYYLLLSYGRVTREPWNGEEARPSELKEF